MRMRSLCVLILLSGAVRADEGDEDRFLVATVKAKATEAWRVFDGNLAKGWCPGAEDTLTIVLDPPAVVDAVTVHPFPIEGLFEVVDIKVDGQPRQVDRETDGTLTAWNPGATPATTITVHAKPKGKVCAGEILLNRGAPLAVLVGVPPEAATALPKAIAGIAGVIGTCDVEAAPRWMQFPLHYDHGSRTDTFATAAALMKRCSRAPATTPFPVMADGDLSSDLTHTAGPGRVDVQHFVENGPAKAPHYQLLWVRDRWLLSGVY
jgi:hypothetical protein